MVVLEPFLTGVERIYCADIWDALDMHPLIFHSFCAGRRDKEGKKKERAKKIEV